MNNRSSILPTSSTHSNKPTSLTLTSNRNQIESLFGTIVKSIVQTRHLSRTDAERLVNIVSSILATTSSSVKSSQSETSIRNRLYSSLALLIASGFVNAPGITSLTSSFSTAFENKQAYLTILGSRIFLNFESKDRSAPESKLAQSPSIFEQFNQAGFSSNPSALDSILASRIQESRKINSFQTSSLNLCEDQSRRCISRSNSFRSQNLAMNPMTRAFESLYLQDACPCVLA